jgi:diguanylate cyclase (GGDEF)-like protein
MVVLGDEAARLGVLRNLAILDQPQPAELNALARLAAYVCGVDTAAVNLIDADRQWQAGTFGMRPLEVSRNHSMCTRAIQSADVTYTPDASLSELFQDHPYVSGELGSVKLYAAAPVVVSEHVVGTVCAFAEEATQLSDEQLGRLEDLAQTAALLLELRSQATDLAQVAMRDPLTGLFNRSVFQESMDRIFARRSRDLTRPGIVFIDLDHFKVVNDDFGHAAGDDVLKELGQRLQDSVRATDLVIRLGGDEFVILVEEHPSPDQAEAGMRALVSRVRDYMASPFTLADGRELNVRASIGWAVDGGRDDSAEALLHRADLAMYADKARARATAMPA